MNEEERMPAASDPEATSPENPAADQTPVPAETTGSDPEAPEVAADQVSVSIPATAAAPAPETAPSATAPAAAAPGPAPTVDQSTVPVVASIPEAPPAIPDRPDPRTRKPALYKPRMDPGQTRFRPRQSMSDIHLADIHYKNVDVLTRFIDGQGRILPRRKTRISAKMQRRVKTAIKQARHLAMLPYTPTHIRSARRR